MPMAIEALTSDELKRIQQIIARTKTDEHRALFLRLEGVIKETEQVEKDFVRNPWDAVMYEVRNAWEKLEKIQAPRFGGDANDVEALAYRRTWTDLVKYMQNFLVAYYG